MAYNLKSLPFRSVVFEPIHFFPFILDAFGIVSMFSVSIVNFMYIQSFDEKKTSCKNEVVISKND